MKKYIGTKEVSAEPMALGDFYLKTGRDPYKGNEDEHKGTEEGYLVQYKDGYESWSPKETFEEAYKLSETDLDRMIIERDDLLFKKNKLALFLGRTDAKEAVGEYQYLFMERQFDVMGEYLGCLNKRIELMKR